MSRSSTSTCLTNPAKYKQAMAALEADKDLNKIGNIIDKHESILGKYTNLVQVLVLKT
ncbi:uncharacterized protein ANIA_11578 [Aspergillus nidulans FGSC A4]|uniref:Uncharacterized protein n=1 Tax=Emericella nidulans (strain FGSC A4 / ATCC 38163 / CBS 112.46 / NRRL 194 / M139) TaxID=227321 RepID=C8VDX9_EMENI|nr:hypothetical protein [Aspergillus nidulans FGSC A4]CBF80237.1 TPA: hypothetical protein ANIA_11578 [Aspergillus nidulans FGSC A4]